MRRLLRRLGSANLAGHHLVTASFWTLVLRIGGSVLAFLVGVQLARYLGPAGFGVYGAVMAAAAILSTAGQFGLPILAMREVAISHSTGDWPLLRGQLRWFAMAVAAVASLLGLCFILAAWAMPGLSQQLRQTAIWAGLVIPLTALIVLVANELRAFGHLVLGQSVDILVRPGALSLLLLLLFWTNGYLGPAVAMGLNCAASALALLAGLWWLQRRIPAAARGAAPVFTPREWIRACTPLGITELLRQVEGMYPVLVMGIVATAAETGVFRVAHSSLAIIAIPLTILQVVLAPTLARLHAAGEKEKLQTILLAASFSMFGAAAVAILALGLGGRQFLIAVFGPDYRGAWIPLMLLSATQAVSGFFGVGSLLLAMGGRERDLLRTFVASVAMSIVLAVVLGRSYGGVGLALAVIGGSLVNNLLAWRYVKTRMGLDSSLLASLRLLRERLG